MKESNLERSEDGESKLEELLQAYEAEHGEQTEEQRTKLKNTWRDAFKDQEIEQIIESENQP